MVSAFINRETNETVVIIINTGNEEISVDIPDNRRKSSMYLTSAKKIWHTLKLPKAEFYYRQSVWLQFV
jgi:hypothetical protein